MLLRTAAQARQRPCSTSGRPCAHSALAPVLHRRRVVARFNWPGQSQSQSQSSVSPAPKPLNLQSATSALWQAQRIYDKYDKDHDGNLSLAEVTALLNSEDIRNIVQTLTNVTPLKRTEADIKALFDAADENKDGSLTRKEFMALYLAILKERVKANPAVLAEALLGFLDTDRNGKIEGGELKVILALLGFPAALIMPIPKFVNVDYRGILKAFDGSK